MQSDRQYSWSDELNFSANFDIFKKNKRYQVLKYEKYDLDEKLQ